METLLICLFIAVIMPMLAKVPLAVAMQRAGGYNNRYPRTQQAKLTGFGARARAAHENAFEAIILFTPGVLAVIAVGAVEAWTEQLAIAFIAARVGYHLAYLANWDKVRSLFWIVGFAVSLMLLWAAIAQA